MTSLLTSVHVVERVCDAVQPLEEFVGVDVFGVGSDAVLVRHHVTSGVHHLRRVRRRAWLSFLNRNKISSLKHKKFRVRWMKLVRFIVKTFLTNAAQIFFLDCSGTSFLQHTTRGCSKRALFMCNIIATSKTHFLQSHAITSYLQSEDFYLLTLPERPRVWRGTVG